MIQSNGEVAFHYSLSLIKVETQFRVVSFAWRKPTSRRGFDLYTGLGVSEELPAG